MAQQGTVIEYVSVNRLFFHMDRHLETIGFWYASLNSFQAITTLFILSLIKVKTEGAAPADKYDIG